MYVYVCIDIYVHKCAYIHLYIHTCTCRRISSLRDLLAAASEVTEESMYVHVHYQFTTVCIIYTVLFSTTVEFHDDIQVLNGDIASKEKSLMEVRPIDV